MGGKSDDSENKPSTSYRDRASRIAALSDPDRLEEDAEALVRLRRYAECFDALREAFVVANASADSATPEVKDRVKNLIELPVKLSYLKNSKVQPSLKAHYKVLIEKSEALETVSGAIVGLAIMGEPGELTDCLATNQLSDGDYIRANELAQAVSAFYESLGVDQVSERIQNLHRLIGVGNHEQGMPGGLVRSDLAMPLFLELSAKLLIDGYEPAYRNAKDDLRIDRQSFDQAWIGYLAELCDYDAGIRNEIADLVCLRLEKLGARSRNPKVGFLLKVAHATLPTDHYRNVLAEGGFGRSDSRMSSGYFPRPEASSAFRFGR